MKKDKQQRPLVNPLGNMYSTDEVAAFLGKSRRTVQRMIRNGELKAIGKGRGLMIPEDELRDWKARELAKAEERAASRRGEKG
jgi:excisionase family DNA binding protein